MGWYKSSTGNYVQANELPGPEWHTASAPAATTFTTYSGANTFRPTYNTISGLFQQALNSLTGEAEKTYQQGKRRTLTDIAMQSINSGMANTLNMPAAGVAYDEANRAATNLALGREKAGLFTGLGQIAAGMYGQNLEASVNEANSIRGAEANYAQQALQRYLGQLNYDLAQRELNAKLAFAKQSSGGSSGSGMIAR